MTLTILFPDDPLKSGEVDSAFKVEAEAALKVGCFIGTVISEAADPAGDLEAEHPGEPAIYRGWMMSANRYRRLYEELWDRGFQLINSPKEYRYCHELPQWYADFVSATPKSVWGGRAIGLEPNEWDYTYVQEALGDGPYIVKDYVKSRKHDWLEACYIPGNDDLIRVTNRFIELQDEYLVGGVVHRQFVPIKQVGKHPKSSAPINNEIRLWILNGNVIMSHAYWGSDEGGADIVVPRDIANLPLVGLVEPFTPDVFSECRFKSNFCTVDIAQHEHGRWVIIELGDGQVSGLPSHVDAEMFYRDLLERFTFRP